MKAFLPICMFSLGCAAAAHAPAAIRVGEDTCAHCRMTLLSTRTAAQIVVAGDEPVIFDELGCLRDYLAAHAPSGEARIYVADHRTGAWLDAAAAVFTRTSIATPMSSGLLAHADAASRDAVAAARGGAAVSRESVLPAAR
jgi:copper chaperone NosL